MGRNDHTARAEIRHDLDKGLGIHTQDWPAVRAEIAQSGELAVDSVHRFKVRSEDEEVNFPDLSFLGVDKADFRREDEGNILRRDRDSLYIVILRRDDISKLVETVSFRFQFVAYEEKPFWMGEIGCGQKLYPLDLSPVGQSVEVHITGGGTGKFGMHMEVCNEFHPE